MARASGRCSRLLLAFCLAFAGMGAGFAAAQDTAGWSLVGELDAVVTYNPLTCTGDVRLTLVTPVAGRLLDDYRSSFDHTACDDPVDARNLANCYDTGDHTLGRGGSCDQHCDNLAAGRNCDDARADGTQNQNRQANAYRIAMREAARALDLAFDALLPTAHAASTSHPDAETGAVRVHVHATLDPRFAASLPECAGHLSAGNLFIEIQASRLNRAQGGDVAAQHAPAVCALLVPALAFTPAAPSQLPFNPDLAAQFLAGAFHALAREAVPRDASPAPPLDAPRPPAAPGAPTSPSTAQAPPQGEAAHVGANPSRGTEAPASTQFTLHDDGARAHAGGLDTRAPPSASGRAAAGPHTFTLDVGATRARPDDLTTLEAPAQGSRTVTATSRAATFSREETRPLQQAREARAPALEADAVAPGVSANTPSTTSQQARATSAPTGAQAGLALAASVALAFVAWALHSRITRRNLLDHPVRGLLARTVAQRPGIGLGELAEAANVHKTTAAYHLRRLEKEGVLVQRLVSGVHLYYANGAQHDAPGQAHAALAAPTTRAVVQAIQAQPGLNVSALARTVGIEVRLARYHVAKLARAGVIETRIEDGERRSFPRI